MKISIIGAGNVGGLTAMRILEEGLGEVILIDKIPGLAKAKALDLEDAQAVLKYHYHIQGSQEIKESKSSDIVIITAGLARKPGMSREELLNKNAQILKDLSAEIKKLAPDAIVIVVTNPLDLMTYQVLKITGFKPNRVFGMGVTLDAARFSNLISKQLNVLNSEIEPCVMGSHGEGMLPLARFTHIKGVSLDEFLDDKKTGILVKETVNRGAEIVSLLGSGSAYFAPSAAIAGLVKVVVGDQKRVLGVSAYLNGEYGIKDVCIGVPCRLGRNGIEKIIELDLNREEKEAFLKSANQLKKQYHQIGI